MGTAQQEIPVDKVYLVLCARNTDPSDPFMRDIWVESVYRTEKGAQDFIRECQAEQLREQLRSVLEGPAGYSPELPLSWACKTMEVKD